MSVIVDFYRGTRPDYLGRSLDEILGWDDDRLEYVHNYIQVLFPLREGSFFNASAPLLDDPTVSAFREDEGLRQNLEQAFESMLHFYGLERDPGSGKVTRAPHFPDRAAEWLSPFNHNYRRITRILRSLTTLGLGGEAGAFFECLAEIFKEHRDVIGEDTFAYWHEALDAK
jgi:hypothetical protein